MVISTFVFVVSVRSVVFGMLAAATSVIAANGFQYICGPLGLPLSWSHSFVLFSFTCLKFTQSSLTPVEFVDLTCPEDHLYRALMCTKIIKQAERDLKSSLKTAKDAASEDLSQALGVDSIQCMAVTENSSWESSSWERRFPRLCSHLWHFVDYVFLIMSWGAYSYSDCQPIDSHGITPDVIASRLAPDWLVNKLLSVWEQIRAVDTEVVVTDLTLKATVLAVKLLSRSMTINTKSIQQFHKIWSKSMSHQKDMEANVVFVALLVRVARQLDVEDQLEVNVNTRCFTHLTAFCSHVGLLQTC